MLCHLCQQRQCASGISCHGNTPILLGPCAQQLPGHILYETRASWRVTATRRSKYRYLQHLPG